MIRIILEQFIFYSHQVVIAKIRPEAWPVIKEVEPKASLDRLSVIGKEEDHDGVWKGSICTRLDDAEHGGPHGASFASTGAPPFLSGKLVLLTWKPAKVKLPPS